MMIKLLEAGSSVAILNTGTAVVKSRKGLSILDRCGWAPFKKPIALDNGVELSSIEGELVIRHPYGLPVHVACKGKLILGAEKVKITAVNMLLTGGYLHGGWLVPRKLDVGDTFDVVTNSPNKIATLEVVENGVLLKSHHGIQLELA